MGFFQVRFDSRVVNYERKMFIRWATEPDQSMDGKGEKTKIEGI